MLDAAARRTNTKDVGLPLAAGIAFLPFVFAWLLLRTGYSNKARALGFGWLVLFLILEIARTFMPQQTQAESAQKIASTTDAGAQHKYLGMGTFQAIQPGLTYTALAGIMGPGELHASSNVAGIRTEIYVWSNSDGSNITLMFQNGVLMSKAQYGLQ